ncbi:MAG: hypothetical protein K8R40_00500 [Anaerolineaceae bacterium]|nr:hypothetical protein [Anaerolineaceae bacterium]
MKKKTAIVVVVIAILVMACSCPITDIYNKLLNRPGPEDLIEMIPDDIIEQLPDPEELLEALPEDIPGEAEELLENLPFGEDDIYIPALHNQDIPENIPVHPKHDDGLISTMGTTYYTVPAPMMELVEFYRVEMVKKGWQIIESDSVVDEDQEYAILHYENEDEDCMVNIEVWSKITNVTLYVTDK